MNPAEIAAIAATVMFAAGVQALSGFGFALLAVPILSLLIVPQHAVVIATGISLATTGVASWRGRRTADQPLATRLIVSSLAGAPFGLLIIAHASDRLLRTILGAVVLLATVALARGWGIRETRSVDAGLGFASGVLSTSLSTNGPPLVFLMQSRSMSPDRFRSTINQVFVVSNVVALVLFASTGLVDGSVVLRIVAALPAAFVGVVFGTSMRPKVSAERFRHVVLVLLVLSGVSALAGGLGLLG